MHTQILYQSARLCLGPSYCDPVTPAIRSLHWLAVCVYLLQTGTPCVQTSCADRFPSYLSSMVKPCNSVKDCICLPSTSAGIYVTPGSYLWLVSFYSS